MAHGPSSAPEDFYAGDDIDWVINTPDTPAPEYNAYIYLYLRGYAPILLAATDYGTEHRFLMSGGSTKNFPPGAYGWLMRAETAPDSLVHTPLRGTLTISPNFATLTPASDVRSHARRALDLIEAALENRIPSGLTSYQVDGRSIAKIPLNELFALREKYRAVVQREEDAAAGRSGLRVHRFAFRRS